MLAKRGMVATAQQLAAQAGLDILKKSGSAIDAPIATAASLIVLEPTSNIGYEVGGLPGSIVALLATVSPSLILLIVLLRLLFRFEDSPKVKWLTLLIRPIIVVMLGMMAWDFFSTSQAESGWLPMILIGAASFVLMQRFRLHPAFVIAGALLIGGLFMG
ncbi:chromate transporter [Sporolactobacillus sp. Y61]|uniref:Chromate transporter n=1 Tax=Sporolactobacillus sp. Y61 TaxID=3160863 RepID=A0AAU8IIU8_9BACL